MDEIWTNKRSWSEGFFFTIYRFAFVLLSFGIDSNYLWGRCSSWQRLYLLAGLALSYHRRWVLTRSQHALPLAVITFLLTLVSGAV